MALQFSTSSKESKANGVKMLVYGPPGTGKTMLCATLPRPIILSAESGLLSLSPQNIERTFGANQPDICYDIPLIKITNVDDLKSAYDWCVSPKNANLFDSIAIDSLTEIAEVVLNNAKRQVKDPRQAYGELIEKMQTTIRLFRDIPSKNVLMTAKMEHIKDDVTGVVKYWPAMPGSKVGPQLAYFFDEVFRIGVAKTQQGESYRFLQTQPDLQYEAKDRSGALSNPENPRLAYVIHKIIGA